MGNTEKVEGGPNPLYLSRRKGRQASQRTYINPRIRVRCGCGCNRTVDFVHWSEHAQEAEIEINGVIGTVAQWRKILRPLLGFELKEKMVGGPDPVDTIETIWTSKFCPPEP